LHQASNQIGIFFP